MSIGQKLQDENTHTLAVGVDCVLLGRADSVGLIGRPGDRARHTGAVMFLGRVMGEFPNFCHCWRTM